MQEENNETAGLTAGLPAETGENTESLAALANEKYKSYLFRLGKHQACLERAKKNEIAKRRRADKTAKKARRRNRG